MRNGDAGSPAPLTRLQSGFLAQAYRTDTGSETFSDLTTTWSFSMDALRGFVFPVGPGYSEPYEGSHRPGSSDHHRPMVKGEDHSSIGPSRLPEDGTRVDDSFPINSG